QTLQQKSLWKKCPGNIVLPKESQPEDPEESTSTGYKSIWHWLIKHPVEFSKNNHTPIRSSALRNPSRGNRSKLPDPNFAVNSIREDQLLVRGPRRRTPD
ncbi:hypothetical protein, partial [Micromonospora musae]|uniref:hypothetical protein n=1 Tax=Micromonospora musae TaxID=1894970 RepID=UPI0034083843